MDYQTITLVIIIEVSFDVPLKDKLECVSVMIYWPDMCLLHCRCVSNHFFCLLYIHLCRGSVVPIININ